MVKKKLRSILLTDPECPICEEVEGILKSEIKSGDVRVVSTESKEGKKLRKKVLLTRTPAIIPVVCTKESKCEIMTPNEAKDVKMLIRGLKSNK